MLCRSGDPTAIQNIYSTCERYLTYLKNRENADSTVTYGLGDWVYYDTQTPTDYTTTCYYYLDNLYMGRFARILGKDGRKYDRKARQLKQLINQKYFDAETGIYANGSQTAQALPLYLELVPHGYEQKVADNLVKKVRENQQDRKSVV